MVTWTRIVRKSQAVCGDPHYHGVIPVSSFRLIDKPHNHGGGITAVHQVPVYLDGP